MGKIESVYIIGSLRNRPPIIEIGNALRREGIEGFDDWISPGPEADDWWKDYALTRGQSYKEALNSWAAKHVFDFDRSHLDRCDAAILVCPAGKSCHLEAGYVVGSGKPLWVLMEEDPKLSEDWNWLAGLYEGEGAISYNKGRNGNPQNTVLSVQSTDFDTIQKLYQISKVGRVQGPYNSVGNNLVKKGNFKPFWRWAVYKDADIKYVIKGIWKQLSKRRQEQIVEAFNKIGKPLEIDDTFIFSGESPWEFRYDVMYQFAFLNGGDILYSVDEIIEKVKNWKRD